jgi:uncharacterized membrane protein
MVRTVLIYGFSLSALTAGPIAILATRLVADRLFARCRGRAGYPAGRAGGRGGAAMVMGALVFGGLAGLPLGQAALASLLLAWLTQIWIAAPMLTALRHYRAVPVAYLIGIGVVALLLAAWPAPNGTIVLAGVTGGTGVTLGAIMLLRRYFTAPPVMPSRELIAWRLALIVAAAGLAERWRCGSTNGCSGADRPASRCWGGCG